MTFGLLISRAIVGSLFFLTSPLSRASPGRLNFNPGQWKALERFWDAEHARDHAPVSGDDLADGRRVQTLKMLRPLLTKLYLRRDQAGGPRLMLMDAYRAVPARNIHTTMKYVRDGIDLGYLVIEPGIIDRRVQWVVPTERATEYVERDLTECLDDRIRLLRALFPDHPAYRVQAVCRGLEASSKVSLRWSAPAVTESK